MARDSMWAFLKEFIPVITFIYVTLIYINKNVLMKKLMRRIKFRSIVFQRGGDSRGKKLILQLLKNS